MNWPHEHLPLRLFNSWNFADLAVTSSDNFFVIAGKTAVRKVQNFFV